MRLAARVDRNQKEIVSALRRAGASILHLHQIGHGAADILVGFGGKNILMEIKDGKKPASAKVLTKDEIEFHKTWRGQVCIVESIDQALRAIKL